MMIARSFLSIVCIFFISYLSNAQNDTLIYSIKAKYIHGQEGYAPLWMHSNQYGLFESNTNDIAILPALDYNIALTEKLKLESGISYAIKKELNESFLYDAFVNINYGQLKLMTGIQEYTLGQYGGDLSSGSFLISSNSRNMMRIGVGFYDFVEVPYTNGYVKVKGALNNSWLDNNRLDHSQINNPMMHEKFAYISTGNFPINLFTGISHTAMYGGENRNGQKIGIDYLAVFTGQGSTAAGIEGEATNAIGEHLGVIEWGLTFKVMNYDITFHQQKPISDRMGFRDNFANNHDDFIGLLIETDEKKIISAFNYEYTYTAYQGGYGVPDVILNIDGENVLIIPGDPAHRQLMTKYYSEKGYDVEGFTERQWVSFLSTYENYGYDLGGRTDYYNNSLYRHIFHDRIIGTPLFYTKDMMTKRTNYQDKGSFVVNNRIQAHHIGIKGWVKDNISYRSMITYTKNFGEWQMFEGRFNWGGIAKDPNFDWFWKDTPQQFYTLLETNIHLPQITGLEVDLGIAYDFGDIYTNLGGSVGIRYSGGMSFFNK